MASLSDDKEAEIQAFKFTSRYLDDRLNTGNPVCRIYPPELQ